MRLIDADKFKKTLNSLQIERDTTSYVLKNIVPMLLDDEPTAFDKEEVIEKLKKLSEYSVDDDEIDISFRQGIRSTIGIIRDNRGWWN